MASIKKRPDGRWRARYRESSGREVARHFARKTDAQRWLDEVTTSVVRGEYVDPRLGRTLVGDWADQWLVGKGNVKASTRDRYAGIIETHVRPAWGSVKLVDVTHDEVQAWVSGLVAAGQSPASVVKVHRVLSMVLAYAVRSRRLASNPADGVTLPRATAAEKRYLRPEQITGLAEAASPVWSLETRRPLGPGRLVVLVLAYCGLRWGELAALKVSR
ncbi:MAG: tyrosine-type recombinase/integrase, partial [bacterium]